MVTNPDAVVVLASHEVLDQQNFITDLTVNQFVHNLACQQDSIPAGTHALLRTQLLAGESVRRGFRGHSVGYGGGAKPSAGSRT